jgi:tetratricopeptide (TPR) repeat protein
MQYTELIKTYDQICNQLHNRKVVNACNLLRRLVKESQHEFLNENIDIHIETYKNILKHSFSGISDPQREMVFHYLVRDLLELADLLKEIILSEKAFSNTYALKKDFQKSRPKDKSELLNILENLTHDTQLTNILKEVKIGSSEIYKTRQTALENLFNFIWFSDKFTDLEIGFLETIITSKELPWHDKCLAVSALTLSIMRYFDINKLLLLFRFVEQQEENVWERALTGIIFSLLRFNDRFYLYPVLHEKTIELREFPDIEKHIEAILIQFTKAKETEKVTDKWEKDILPEMMKMRTKIEDKLDLDNLFSEKTGEETNPDWETVFEDEPGLLDKLAEFTQMQMEGMDVFMSTFAHLKHFMFFKITGNWFLPFYSQNENITRFLKDPENDIDLSPLVEKLESTYFLCNSDKYSFCLNLELIPLQQKNMMMNMMQGELKQMSEIEKDENLLNNLTRSKNIYSQYFQDLYRFYKLHPWKKEFEDIFNPDFDVFQSGFLKALITNKSVIRNIAELFLEKKFFNDALKVFLSLHQEDKHNTEIFEKIAFCYEKINDFKNALDYYKQAELIETGRPWIIRKLALCNKNLGNWEEALEYFRDVEKHSPEDMHIQANIGQCLIHLSRYEDALKYYFKVEVLAPENEKIRRPLAWCSFLLGKFETAENYLLKILENEPDNKYDLMNLGHVYWCVKQPQKAISYYLLSLKNWKSFKDFENSFDEDRKHLLSHGVSETDIDLMLDYVRIKDFENK